MINTLDNDDEHLVYMCYCDEAQSIFEDQFIKGKKYVSFSRGMPIGITHGDTAIVFTRSKLESKGYKFINIEYTKEYFDKHPDLKEHVYGDIFDTKNISKILKKDIKGLKKLNVDKKKIKYIKNQIEQHKNDDISPYVLNACSREKGAVLTDNCIDFEPDDIEAIICSSRTVHKYYPLSGDYSTKIMYIHDYYPCTSIMPSPLNEYCEELEIYFDEIKESVPELDTYIAIMYHYVYQLAINEKSRIMAMFDPKPVMELSQIFEQAFINLPKIDKADKQDFVDRLLNKSILYNNKESWLEDSFRT
jgi:hypothetical protein